MQNFENQKLNTLENIGSNFLRMNKTGITTNNANNLSNEKIVKVDINKKTNTAGFLRRTAEMPQLCHLDQVVLARTSAMMSSVRVR